MYTMNQLTQCMLSGSCPFTAAWKAYVCQIAPPCYCMHLVTLTVQQGLHIVCIHAYHTQLLPLRVLPMRRSMLAAAVPV
jgi:hypothetical protein